MRLAASKPPKPISSEYAYPSIMLWIECIDARDSLKDMPKAEPLSDRAEDTLAILCLWSWLEKNIAIGESFTHVSFAITMPFWAGLCKDKLSADHLDHQIDDKGKWLQIA